MLAGYACGIFPMARSRDDPHIDWIEPRLRGIIPLDGFHVSRSLARRIRNAPWTIRTDTAFNEVVLACAAREETWINDTLLAIYEALHQAGNAHSLEVWEGDELVGGVFGVTLGTAFFGESMFSRRSDASKVALAYLVDRLRQAGFTLFDTQFLTPHLASLGAVEIPRTEYLRRLGNALKSNADYGAEGAAPSAASLLQRMAQTS